EVWERCRVNHVVAVAGAQQVKEYSPAESERRNNSPLTATIERHSRANRYDRDARDSGRLFTVPLSESQKRDLVSSRRERLGERAIPALGAADAPRIQTVINDADLHAAGDRSGEHLRDRPDRRRMTMRAVKIIPGWHVYLIQVLRYVGECSPELLPQKKSVGPGMGVAARKEKPEPGEQIHEAA